MSNPQRVLLLVVGAAIIVGALIVLSPGSDNNNAPTTAAPVLTTANGTTVTATNPTPNFPVVNVQNGQPVGGIQTIKAHHNDTVRFQVASPDTTSEVHLHGYDIKRNLKAGGHVTFVFKATSEGVFEAELEETSTQIIKLVIEP